MPLRPHPPAPARSATRSALGQALCDAGAGLCARPALAWAAADDGLRLDLPPLGLPARPAVTTQAAAAWGALYLHAELERAGVLPVVEAVVDSRHTLSLRQPASAQRLEAFARGTPRQHTRSQRAELYARLFGIGDAARVVSRHPSRHPSRIDFMQRLLRHASALLRADIERHRIGRISPAGQAVLRMSAANLLDLLAAQPDAWLLLSAKRIHARTLEAFALLGDEGLRLQLGARSAWHCLRLLADARGLANADIDLAAQRGAAGQTLLTGLGPLLAALSDNSRELPAPEAATAFAALRWMGGLGLPLPQATLPGRTLANRQGLAA